MDTETHIRQFTRPECERLLRHFGYDNHAQADYSNLIRLYEAVGKCGRGFALRGINGIGKTMATRALLRSNLFEDERIHTFSMCNQGNVELLTTLSGVLDHAMPKNGIWLFIDDVGKEEAISNYGIRYESFAKAVQRIYNANQGGTKIRLCLTTNLSDDDIVQRYGDHVADRIDELVVWLDMSGRGRSERRHMEITHS